MATDGWRAKENVVHVHNGILFSHNKEWNLATGHNMALESIMLSEISQAEKDKYGMISLICGI